jgi:F-type H+-transporting ATPase subunit epsilon|tara:strand:+ start:514 stop:906 length:393 start_codon:yes stop_codon:yes gene_type:complete
MSNKFNILIISPDKTILKSEVSQVTIPAYEGLMTILKDHISLVTFMRPGFIETEINNNIEKIYVEEGTVEFSDNNLLILSSTAKNKKDFSNQEAQKALEDSKSIMKSDEINDKEKYLLSYKIEALQQVIS